MTGARQLQPTIHLRDAIERFLTGIRHGGRAAATIRNYRADLGAFARAAEEIVAARQLERLVRDHLDRLAMAKRSWNRHLSTLRGFCDYLVAEGALPANPLAGVAGRSVAQRAPGSLRTRDVRQLFERIDRPRDRALVRLLWDCGLRVGEALRLKLSDADVRHGTIAVADGDRKRVAKLSPAARRALAQYLTERRTTKTKLLFVANGGRRLSYAAAHRVFRLYAGHSGLTMRRLRAGAATAAFVAGASLAQVQEMLGHQHAASTARYGAANNSAKK